MAANPGHYSILNTDAQVSDNTTTSIQYAEGYYYASLTLNRLREMLFLKFIFIQNFSALIFLLSQPSFIKYIRSPMVAKISFYLCMACLFVCLFVCFNPVPVHETEYKKAEKEIVNSVTLILYITLTSNSQLID